MQPNRTPDPPSNNNQPPDAPERCQRSRRPVVRYGFEEFSNPRSNQSTSAFVQYRSQTLSTGAIFWDAILAVFA